LYLILHTLFSITGLYILNIFFSQTFSVHSLLLLLAPMFLQCICTKFNFKISKTALESPGNVKTCLLRENWAEFRHSIRLKFKNGKDSAMLLNSLGHTSKCKIDENVQDITKFWKHSSSVCLCLFSSLSRYSL
jgi:hypothetical protein